MLSQPTQGAALGCFPTLTHLVIILSQLGQLVSGDRQITVVYSHIGRRNARQSLILAGKRLSKDR